MGVALYKGAMHLTPGVAPSPTENAWLDLVDEADQHGWVLAMTYRSSQPQGVLRERGGLDHALVFAMSKADVSRNGWPKVGVVSSGHLISECVYVGEHIISNEQCLDLGRKVMNRARRAM